MEFKSSKATYKVVEPLSAKEYSKVFKCNSNGISDFCVLKVIPKSPFLNVNQVQCSIKIQSKIHNQYFPPFIETFEDANSYIIVTQFARGTTFSHYLKCKEPKFTEEKAKCIMKQMFEAIIYLHSQGISHRDINLDNVLIDNFDKIIIVGFGSSSNSNNEFTINPKTAFTCFDNSESILKHPTLGTFDDTWALGVFLYYILTGKPPYTGLNPYDLVSSMNGGNVLKPSNMSVPCYNLLLKLLYRNNQSHYSISLAQNHFWFSSNGKSGLYSKSLIGYQKFKIQKDNMHDNRHNVTTNYSQKNVCDRSIFQNYRGSNIQQQDFSNPYHMSFNRVTQQTFG